MFKMTFSGVATLLCVSFVLCAKVGSAQSCQNGTSGRYAFSAIGTGAPGALLTTNTTTPTPAYSSTPLGQLLTGIAGTGPFASTGTFYLDGTGNIRTSSLGIVAGTYVVNSDCTIAVTLTDVFGTNTTITTLQGIILAGGAEIDLAVLQNTGSSTAPGPYQSNMVIKLFRPLATYCSPSNLNGSYGLVATGTKVASVAPAAGTFVAPSQTVTSFVQFGRVQFDGNGNILPQAATSSSLGFLQFAGSYTVNTDCTGTLTLGPNTSPGTTSGATLSLSFVLTQPSVVSVAMRPDIQFNMFNGTQTLSGRGQAQ